MSKKDTIILVLVLMVIFILLYTFVFSSAGIDTNVYA